MNEIFEKIYNDNNTSLNEDMALFEKVYTEAEMLNEMNPKLRALLAAGLIGTASLGAASCSMPTDNPYDLPTIEQPTPENPEEIEEIEDSENSEEITDSEEIEDSGEIEDSEDSEDFEDPENPEDSENLVTFETLGVEEYAKSLARALKDLNAGSFNVIKDLKAGSTDIIDLIYDNGFVPVEFDRDGEYSDGQSYIRYIDVSDKIVFNVPVSMESDLDTAIAAYNNAQ